MTIWNRLCDNKEEIIRRYLANESTVSIARSFECNGGYIWTFLKKNNVEIRQTKKVEPNYDNILALHETGLSAYAINKKLGIPEHTSQRALAKAGIDISHRQKRREDPLVNHRDEIISRYNGGEGVFVIAKDYGCQDASIIRLLRREGIRLRPLRYYSNPVDESFFDVIDTESKAYTLGYFFADGCNQSQTPAATISITDRDILETMMAAMSYGGPIREVKPRKPTHKTQFAVSLGSRRLCDALTKLGCVRNKTYIGDFPTEEMVPSYLARHLIRGWNDGDGCITENSKRHIWSSTIVGNEKVCKGISACVNKHLGFCASVTIQHRGAEHLSWGFTVGGKNQLRRYLDWLYEGATIYLPRKRAKYLEFLSAVYPTVEAA